MRSDKLRQLYKLVMRSIPQPVTVITSSRPLVAPKHDPLTAAGGAATDARTAAAIAVNEAEPSARLFEQEYTAFPSTSGPSHPAPAAREKKGMTCSSFTNVSFDPPIVSFCMRFPSQFYTVLRANSGYFAVNVLSSDQIRYAQHFAVPNSHEDAFHLIPYHMDANNCPILENTASNLSCRLLTEHPVGDHLVLYGHLEDTHLSEDKHKKPLLYFSREYHSIGDQIFMQAFEEQTLPFEDWTHEAHIRMAWNYISVYGEAKAQALIILGIQRYNERNKHLITHGYHETITRFYTHMIASAIRGGGGRRQEQTTIDEEVVRRPQRETGSAPATTFDEFLSLNPYIADKSLPFKYYSKDIIASEEAAKTFVEPDLQPLPR